MDQNPDPLPGFTANGHRLEQETNYGHSSRGNPITQDSGGVQQAPALRSRIRPETEIRRRTPHQFEDTPNAPINSEHCSEKGDQRPPPREILDEAGTVCDKHISNGKNISPAENLKVDTSLTLANTDIVKDLQESKDNPSSSFEKSHIKNGQFLGHDPEVWRKKIHTGDGQKVTTKEDNSDSVREDQAHSPKDDIPPNLGQLPASTNLSKTGDQLPEVENNLPPDKDHKRKWGQNDVFSGKKVASLFIAYQYTSTDSAKDVQSGETNLSKTGDQLPEVENNLPPDKDHKRKWGQNDVFSGKKVIIVFLIIASLFIAYQYTSTDSAKDVQSGELVTHQYMIYNASGDFPGNYVQDGDLLAIRRYWGLYHHYVIYKGNGSVVHLTGGIIDWFLLSKGRVKMERFDEVIAIGDYFRIENGTSPEGKEPLPTKEIINRTKSANGKGGYNLFFNNCEHFARWCRYGETSSYEAKNLMFVLQHIFGTCIFMLFLLIVGLVLHSCGKKKSFHLRVQHV